MDDALFDRYENDDGQHLLEQMYNLIKDENELNKTYKKIIKELKSKEFIRDGRIENDKLSFFYEEEEEDSWSLINQMINDGIIFKEQDTLQINQVMKDTLEKFLAFLKELGI